MTGASSRRPGPRMEIRWTRWSFMTPRPRRAWCCAARSLASCKRFKRPSTTTSAMIASSPSRKIRTASGSCKAFGDLPLEVKEELEKFFVATDELEAKTLKFLGWQGPAQAKKLVRRCEKIFKKKN